MLFNSLPFVGFFAVVLAFVHGVRAWGERGRQDEALWLRNAGLLVASYAFYAFWDWRFLGLIVLSTVVDFVAGQRIANATGRARRRWLQLSLGVNLGLLAIFKYLGFFVASAVDALARLGIVADVGPLSIVLPVGISFYTFQTLSYTIDVHRGRLDPEPSPDPAPVEAEAH